jgi:uncharacterized protein YccT (UPF0319 family)
MNEITPMKEHLPTTVEELNAFILIGKQKLIAHKAKIRAIRETRMGIAAYEAALKDTQDMAEILLDAEVRMGEVLDAIPPQSSQAGRLRTLPEDVSYKQSHQAQTLSRHPEIVEQAKAEARENGEIVTASKVYQIIKAPQVEESDALFHLKRWWKKATQRDRKSFIEWMGKEQKK